MNAQTFRWDGAVWTGGAVAPVRSTRQVARWAALMVVPPNASWARSERASIGCSTSRLRVVETLER